MRAASSALAVALAAGLGLGCTLTRLDFTECEANAECRAQFGFGFVCNPDGLCEEAARFSRCNATFPEDVFHDPEAHADSIIFGNLMDRSLATHRAREQSARLAVKQATDEGGLELRDVGIVFCTIEEDSEFDFLERQEAAVASATYLIDTLGVPAIIGPASSDDTQYVFQTLRDRGTLFISPSATSPALTDLEMDPTDDDPGLLWRTAPPDSLQGAAIAYDMRAPGVGRTEVVESVAVIHHTGAYGRALAQVFKAAFDADGGSATLLPFETDGDMAEKIGAAAIGAFDEVLFVSGQTTDVIAFMDSAAELSGFDGKGIFLTDAGANPDLLSQANPARFPQVRGTRQAPRDEDNDLVFASFVAGYASEYGGEDVSRFSFTANAYDAAWLLAYGSAWSLFQEGAVSGTGIAKGLRRVSAGDPVETLPTEWNMVVETFRGGDGIDVSGASGELDYDPATEETSGEIETWEIDGGAIAGIYTWPPEE